MFDNVRLRGLKPLPCKVDGVIDPAIKQAEMDAIEQAMTDRLAKAEADTKARVEARAAFFGAAAELALKLETAKKGGVIELSDGSKVYI